MDNIQKTENEKNLERVKAIQAIMFDTISHDSVLYWHYLTIKNERGEV